MKLNKLLVSSALILVLGLGACNTKKSDGPVEPSSSEQESESSSESQVDPVSRIKIEAPSTIVVGQPVDLDDYVTIEGGEGPKVFDVQIPATMTELVEVEGHQLTALAEGTVNVKIIAGAREAKFETDAMSALKAAFAEATAELSNVWAMDELYEGQLYVGAVHRADYSCFGAWDDETDAPGGFLKAQNGKTYQYVLDDNFENIEVDSAIQADFDLYYCNYPWLLSASDFETVKDEEGNESLVMSGDLAGSWGISSCPNKAAEFAYTLAQALSSKYMFNGIIVTPYTLGEGEDAVETFQFDLPIVAVADKTTVLATYSYVLDLDEEETEISAVRDYIDSGAFPEALPFDEIQTSFNAIATAKVYKYSLNGAWRNLTTGEKAECPEDLASHGYDQYFMDETETSIVTANAKYTELGSGSKFGFVEKDGQLYRFANEQNQETSEWGTELKASALEGKATLWGDLPAETLAAFAGEAVWADFEVTDRTVDEANNKVTLGFDADVASAKVFEALMGPTEIGYYLNYILANGWKSDMRSYFSCSVTINTTTNEVSFYGYMSWDGTIGYVLQASIGEIGTAELPDLSGIVYPEA